MGVGGALLPAGGGGGGGGEGGVAAAASSGGSSAGGGASEGVSDGSHGSGGLPAGNQPAPPGLEPFFPQGVPAGFPFPFPLPGFPGSPQGTGGAPLFSLPATSASSSAAAAAAGNPEDAQTREALQFVLSPEGSFFREFLLDEAVKVWLYKFKSVETHSLKAPGFSTLAPITRETGFKVYFSQIRLVPLREGHRRAGARQRGEAAHAARAGRRSRAAAPARVGLYSCVEFS
jgi:hypothetical protein